MNFSIQSKSSALKALLLLAMLCSTSFSYVISLGGLKPIIKSNLPHPVILIPGDGGSQAYAQFRDLKSDPFPIWIDLRYLISPKTFCEYFKQVVIHLHVHERNLS